MENLLTITLCLSVLLSCSNSETHNSTDLAVDRSEPTAAVINRDLESPDISINVKGVTSGKATLIGMFTEQQYMLDEATFDDLGNLRFKREEPYQPGMAFILLPDQSFLQLLIDADQTFEMTTTLGNLINGMQVSGSLENELLYRNLSFEMNHQPKINAVNQQLKTLLPVSPEYSKAEATRDELIKNRKDHLSELFEDHPNSFFVRFKTAGQNPDLRDVRRPNGDLDSSRQLYIYRNQFWDNVDFSDERLLYTPVISNKLKRYITELTPQVADSINAAATFLAERSLPYPDYYQYFVNWITLNYEPGKTTLMDGEAVYCHMVKDYFTNERAFWSDSFEVYSLYRRAQEMQLSLIGMKGPDVTADDLDGNPKTLFDLTSPYIIVYLFSPSCDHCIEESPKLVQFYSQWKNKGLEVYSIGVETSFEELKKFVLDNGMDTWINVYDPTNVAIYGKYFVDNTPEVYLLNPERVIIGKNLKVDQIEALIKRDQRKH